MTTIVGIAGSLRAGAINAELLRAAVAEMPPGATLATASIRGIPLYDGDLEAAQGIPETVRELKEQIVAADGLGTLVDARGRAQLRTFLAGFAVFTAAHRRG